MLLLLLVAYGPVRWTKSMGRRRISANRGAYCFSSCICPTQTVYFLAFACNKPKSLNTKRNSSGPSLTLVYIRRLVTGKLCVLAPVCAWPEIQLTLIVIPNKM